MVRGRRPTGVPIARDKEGVRLIPGVPLSGSSRFALPRAIAVTLSGFILWWFSIALLLVVGLWILAHGLWNFLRVPLCIPPCSLWLNLDPRCLRPQGVPIARESLISAPNNRSVIPIRQFTTPRHRERNVMERGDLSAGLHRRYDWSSAGCPPAGGSFLAMTLADCCLLVLFTATSS